MDIDKLIEQIESEVKHSAQVSFGSKVYSDEPILRRASKLPNYIPPEYREMKKLAQSGGSYGRSAEKLFYEQGKLMEDFEDDYEYNGTFERYYPTYQSMSTGQLRGYFSWRTKVRHGNIEPTSLSFAFVYIYELINQIGVKSAEEGFHKLLDFSRAYGQIDRHIRSYAKMWLSDYVVYYGLDKSLLGEISDLDFDGALLVLIDHTSHDDDEVFRAMSELSSYNIGKSKFYKAYPDDVKSVACAVYARLSEYYGKNRKNSYAETLFGRKVSCEYYMFSSAVFYDRMRYDDYEYEINSINRYRCTHGKWVCERYFGARGKNRQLGELMKAVDSVMRQKYGFASPLKSDGAAKYIIGIIEKETDRFLERKKQNERPKIEIDVSKLAGIRSAADVTRDKLIVDEEYEDSEPIVSEPAASVDTEVDEPAVTETAVSNDTCLNDTEYGFMRIMLYGGDYAAYARGKGVMVSVLADSVNEKLFDMFGDTVLLFNGDEPELIEDYTDELKGIIKQ